MPTCKLEVCQEVMGIFEAHYGSIPNDQARLEMTQRKFASFVEALGSKGFECEDYICLPMLQLISRINQLKEE